MDDYSEVNSTGNSNINLGINNGTVEINQMAGDNPEQFKYDPEDIKEYSLHDISREGWQIAGWGTLAAVLGVIAQFTDILAKLNVDIPAYSIWPILFTITIILFLLAFFYSFNEKFRFWCFLAKGKEVFLDNGYFYIKKSDNLVGLNMSCKCSYPFCQGAVFLDYPPPREKSNNFLIGRCSVDPFQHTYRVDNNFVLYKQHMNWAPIDEIKK